MLSLEAAIISITLLVTLGDMDDGMRHFLTTGLVSPLDTNNDSSFPRASQAPPNNWPKNELTLGTERMSGWVMSVAVATVVYQGLVVVLRFWVFDDGGQHPSRPFGYVRVCRWHQGNGCGVRLTTLLATVSMVISIKGIYYVHGYSRCFSLVGN